MSETKARYLVYRPERGYEDSLEPYLICDTLERAQEVKTELLSWIVAIAETMPTSEEYAEDSPDNEYKWHIKSCDIKDNAIAPYGLDNDTCGIKRDIPWSGGPVDMGCVDIMPLLCV